ncbi:Uncharacterised protein [uncultured archaeon]|nr:Uncharacterised protein [uncultured archaeon]
MGRVPHRQALPDSVIKTEVLNIQDVLPIIETMTPTPIAHRVPCCAFCNGIYVCDGGKCPAKFDSSKCPGKDACTFQCKHYDGPGMTTKVVNSAVHQA